MRIYLDSCVFQDLKKEECRNLLALVKADKQYNIYCYSEAHLYDLSRDLGNDKYDDMEFIERIVDANCFSFNEKVLFNYKTPREYYDLFDWSNVAKQYALNDSDFGKNELFLKNTTIQLADYITTEQLPVDFPKSLMKLISTGSNLFDIFSGFMSYTKELTTNQKSFKDLIKYLHNNSLTTKLYESIGIKGYNGNSIYDEETFNESYTDFYLNSSTDKTLYSIFINMYNGLEIFGIVKGKPKRQQMMNLINDARHAFFGAQCDIVVSKDSDFLNKTKFFYDLRKIETLVLDIPAFEDFITKTTTNSYDNLLSELEDIDTIEAYDIKQVNDTTYTLKKLKNTHFGYFDTITFLSIDENKNFFFSKKSNNLSKTILTKEVEFVTNRLITELGIDINNSGLFQANEIQDNRWLGRKWIIKNIEVNLNFDKKIYLLFSPSSN